MTLTTHQPTLSADDLLSRRHAPSMLMLAAAAGAVNAGAWVICERFVTHVTGTATRVGVDAGQWLLMAEYGLVLAAFIAGAMASVIAIQARSFRGLPPLPALPLFGTAAILLGTAAAGVFGVFGAVGGGVEEAGDFAFLSVLAFAMGLMNAAVASSTALAMRTTHMTGPATDFGVTLVTAWLSEGDARRRALYLAGLRGGKVAGFILGAASMVPLVPTFGFLAFLAPATLIIVATVRSFVPLATWVRGPASRRTPGACPVGA